MKKITLYALCAVLVLLAACASPASGYRSDVPVSELSDAVGALFPDSMTSMKDSYLRGAMKLDPDMFDEYCVMLSASGTSIDEYGIFRAGGAASVSDVKAAAEGYLDLRRESWMPEYLPQERPKLDSAVAEVRGQYVIYVIGDGALCSEAVAAFENALK